MKTFIFDMDGVLFDTERVSHESWLKVVRKHGWKGMEQVALACIGRNAADTRQYVQDCMGCDFPYDAFRAEVSDCFENEIAQFGVPIKEGVREILSYLKQCGFRIGLASSTRYEKVTAYLERTGLLDYFSVIVTGDMVTHSKPLPDIYLLACRKMGITPEKAYAIEDSPNGIRAAYAAGMKPIMIPDLIVPDEEMKQKTFLICENFLQLKQYLAQEQRAMEKIS